MAAHFEFHLNSLEKAVSIASLPVALKVNYLHYSWSAGEKKPPRGTKSPWRLHMGIFCKFHFMTFSNILGLMSAAGDFRTS